MLKLALNSVLVAALAVGAARSPQTPPTGPTPAPSPIATVTPLPSPSVAPSITPVPSNSPLPTPLPSASPLPTPLVLPPDATPQILAVQVSDTTLHSGQTVSGTVITSTNAAAVELRVAGQAMRLKRGDAGVWELTYTVPHIPFWARKRYNVQVVAMNTAGVETAQGLQFWLR